MKIQITNKKSGNCPCMNCGKVQEGLKLQPVTLWHKADNEKRGHQEPCCSIECAKQLAERMVG